MVTLRWLSQTWWTLCVLLQKNCDEQKALLKHRYKPSLFQHVGLHSSLSGKLQHLKVREQAEVHVLKKPKQHRLWGVTAWHATKRTVHPCVCCWCLLLSLERMKEETWSASSLSSGVAALLPSLKIPLKCLHTHTLYTWPRSLLFIRPGSGFLVLVCHFWWPT